jgi:hypothetical protein
MLRYRIRIRNRLLQLLYRPATGKPRFISAEALAFLDDLDKRLEEKVTPLLESLFTCRTAAVAFHVRHLQRGDNRLLQDARGYGVVGLRLDVCGLVTEDFLRQVAHPGFEQRVEYLGDFRQVGHVNGKYVIFRNDHPYLHGFVV